MLQSLAEFSMSLLLEIMECILWLEKRKPQGSTFHFFCHQVRGPHFPITGLYYRSSPPIFINCMATTSVWFGRLHQKLAVTGGMLLPVCLLRACPHMYLWHTVHQVWCWIGKGLATETWMCSICLWHFKFVFTFQSTQSLADFDEKSIWIPFQDM